MAFAECCTEQEVQSMVHAFYARVRQDEVLGPIFEAHISDWDQHLSRLVDFWSSVLRHTARFSGAPMARHAALPGLNEALFARWLELFDTTLAEQPNQELAAMAGQAARRIAQSLWAGYQMQARGKAHGTTRATHPSMPSVVAHV